MADDVNKEETRVAAQSVRYVRWRRRVGTGENEGSETSAKV